jgi:hypothetical protein
VKKPQPQSQKSEPVRQEVAKHYQVEIKNAQLKPGKTIYDLVNELNAKYPGCFSVQILEHGEPKTKA